MKKCASCKNIKPLSDFRKDKTRKDGLQTRCKQCASIAYKKAYQERYADKIKVRNKKRWDENRKRLVEHKRSACEKCGETHIACLELHHVDPSRKEFQLSSSLHMRWERIEEELKKCQLLCANCHRKVHHEQI